MMYQNQLDVVSEKAKGDYIAKALTNYSDKVPAGVCPFPFPSVEELKVQPVVEADDVNVNASPANSKVQPVLASMKA